MRTLALLVAQAPAAPPAPAPNFDTLAFVLLDVAIILIVARLLAVAFQKIGQPGVVGQIVAGVLLGPTLFGPKLIKFTPWGWMNCDIARRAQWAADLARNPKAPQPSASLTLCFFPPQARSVIGILGSVALIFFMFMVGLEVDFDKLKGKTFGIASVAFGSIAVPIALGFVVGPMLGDAFRGTPTPSSLGFNLMTGAMLSVTAFPVMARILQEKGLTQSAMGAIGVAAAAVVTILMFLSIAVAAGVAKGEPTGDIVTKVIAALVYIAVMWFAVRPLAARLGTTYERTGFSPALLVWILVIVFASSYVAHRLGINVIVGAFMAGLVLPARLGLFRDLNTRLQELTPHFLLPFFLAFSGLTTDFTLINGSVIGGIVVFLVAGIVAKWGAGIVFGRLGGLTMAEGNVIGVLMNCRGLLVLVAALVARETGVISPVFQVGGVLMALITTIMTGPLFDKFLPSVAGSAPAPAAAPVTAAAKAAPRPKAKSGKKR